MIKLAHGCQCSELKVIPSSWERSNASIKKEWIIYYRFYDPLFKEQYPDGKQVKIRNFNKFKDLKQRQEACRTLLANELKLLQEQDYNPITGIFKETEEISYAIHPNTGVCDALDQALPLMHVQENTRDGAKSSLKYIKMAFQQLRLDDMPVKDVKRRHIKLVLEQCGKGKATFTAATFNRYRRDLSMIFKELLEIEAVDDNPVSLVSKMKGTRKLKVLLTDDERMRIHTHLHQRNYTFWRFVNIFFHSGARTTEIMKVRKEDVDLRRQLVKYTINKGKVVREVQRPIKNNALWLWKEVVEAAAPGDYLFSEALKPGPRAIRIDQVKRRWNYWVQSEKTGLGIKASWYSLKHLNTDEMAALLGVTAAAKLNEHSEEMVTNHYAVNHGERVNEIIRNAGNDFAPSATKKPA